MKQITLSQALFKLNEFRTLSIAELTICQGQHWAFIGTNNSGKSALACALSNELIQLSGEYQNTFQNISHLSLEHLQKIQDEENKRNNSDLLAENEYDSGRTAKEIILEDVPLTEENQTRCNELAQQFAISPLLDRRFKYLSTGETRKTLLCKMLMSKPDLLILDEPFDGLDTLSRHNLAENLQQLADQKETSLILILSRFELIPDFVSHVGILADCSLQFNAIRQVVMANETISQLAYTEKLQQITLPEADSVDPDRARLLEMPSIVLHDGYVHYNNRPIINHLDWTVAPHQHWQIIGPNGAGKSTLLSLVTGDHPQGFSNDLTLFGRRRGSGETIWDIKKHIGYVSSSLHQDYRVSASVGNVVLSGYVDSIGMYQTGSERQKQLMKQWLELIGMEKQLNTPFHSLSWGQQRLLLIVRALVKHPLLLILDEPLQGLDALNRQLVKHWIDILIAQGKTQLLFVSHQQEDAPGCITHRLFFIADGDSYRYKIEVL